MKTHIVDEDTLERWGTLEQSDLGKMYVLIQGAYHEVENQEEADQLGRLLAKYGKE